MIKGEQLDLSAVIFESASETFEYENVVYFKPEPFENSGMEVFLLAGYTVLIRDTMTDKRVSRFLEGYKTYMSDKYRTLEIVDPLSQL